MSSELDQSLTRKRAPGAGRPRGPETALRVRFSISLPPDLADKVNALPERSRSAFIAQALKHYFAAAELMEVLLTDDPEVPYPEVP